MKGLKIFMHIYAPNPFVLVFHQSELISLCSFALVICVNIMLVRMIGA